MGNPFKSEVPTFPLGFAMMLRNWCDCWTFVETGTYQGATARLVAPHFRRVLTVEGVRERFDELSRTGALADTGVHRYFGASDKWLKSLPKLVKGPCIIFLDAHWIHAGMDIDDDTYQFDLSVCPLMNELKAIDMKVPHVILIDDAHFFTHPPKNRGDEDAWLSLDQIVRLLPDRYVFIHEGMICAVPERFRADIREWLKGNWRDAERIPAACCCHRNV